MNPLDIRYNTLRHLMNMSHVDTQSVALHRCVDNNNPRRMSYSSIDCQYYTYPVDTVVWDPMWWMDMPNLQHMSYMRSHYLYYTYLTDIRSLQRSW